MIDRNVVPEGMSLSHRALRASNALAAMSSLEPVQIAFGLRHLRRKFDKLIDKAEKPDELIELAKAYVIVVEPLMRLCQVPTPPKGRMESNGTKARPILDMQVVPDA